MIKIRWMGTPEDLKWFRKHLEEDKEIRLQNVSKAFGGKQVLDNINLDIKKGEFVTLLGPSGCGKTTTLRLISGFTAPDL